MPSQKSFSLIVEARGIDNKQSLKLGRWGNADWLDVDMEVEVEVEGAVSRCR